MQRFSVRQGALAASSLLFASLISAPSYAVPERISTAPAEALTRLRANAAGSLFVGSSPKNAYTLLQATGDQPLMADNPALPPLERARVFLSIYGAALGISDPVSQLQLARISTDQKGQRHVHLDQVHEGLPVYGARVIVHMDASGITGVNGVFIRQMPSTALAAQRPLTGLRNLALADSGKTHGGAELKVVGGRWVVYPEGLLRGQLGTARLAYEVLVNSTGGKRVLERVLVDATTGRVLDRINDLHTFLNREVYTPDQTAPPMYDESATTLATPKGPADPPLVNDPGPHSTTMSSRNTRRAEDNLWIFDGGTYALYANMFGRKGYDACDLAGPCQPDQPAPDWSPLRGSDYVGQVQKTVYLINQNCPNAYWNGDSTNYCPGFDGDDVVSHEWSHAYTQYMHGLIYAYQSGALNESWSDIFGESYDLLNGQEGPLGANLAENEYYEDGGSRWVVGEDLSEEVATLLLRDMWKPDDFPAANPGKTTSENYSCGAGDGGGVHFNSSVPNHAFAMLVDGTKDQGPPGSTGAERDSYNGQSFMPGIGIVKALQIYFYAENNYQTPTTDFPQHANALRMSCQQLKGVHLNGPNGTDSGQVIGQADCDKLEQAMLATVMDAGTPCPYKPVLRPDGAPAVCEGANDVLVQNWENGDAGWTKTSTGVFAGWDSSSDLHNFVLKSGDLPENHPGKVAFADNIPIGEPGGGNCPGGDGYNAQTDDMTGEYSYDSPVFTVPAGATDLKLRFDHYVNTEAYAGAGPAGNIDGGADGGQLWVKVDNGSFTLVDKADYIYNETNTTLIDATGTSTNPHGGEDAWAGVDVNPPSGSGPAQWGTTVVNLAALAQPGQKVQLRFLWSQDGCNGTDGWYIDNIRAYSCPTLEAPVLSIGSDYENPDTNGSFTLSWTRPAGATGPDTLQKSKTSCAPLLSDDAASLAAWTAAADPGGPSWTTSSTKGGHEGNSAFFAQPVSDEFSGTATLTLKAPLAIPAAGATRLTFTQWYYNEDDDRAYLEVSTDNGTTWTRIYTQDKSMGSLPDEAAASYAADDLTGTEIDLTPYAGQSIRLRFSFVQGEFDYFFFVAYGWFLDDIRVINDNWGDILNTASTSTTLANQLDGLECFRVRTAYPVSGVPTPSKYSNVVSATVQAGLANLPPVANAGPDQSVVTGSAVTLDGSQSTEPNGDALTYSWQQLSGDSVSLADATSAKPSFTAPLATGALIFRLTVRDPGGAQSTDTVTVTVIPAPEETAGNNRFAGALPAATLLLLGLSVLVRRRRR